MASENKTRPATAEYRAGWDLIDWHPAPAIHPDAADCDCDDRNPHLCHCSGECVGHWTHDEELDP